MNEPLILRALSVQLPWLEMILRGAKSLEIRSWEIKQRGLIALHAPWGIDYPAAHFFGFREPWKLHRGAIVGVADVTGVVELEESEWPQNVMRQRQPIPLAGGHSAAVLGTVFRLPHPVSYRGRPMIFPLEPDISDRVLAQCPDVLRSRLQFKTPEAAVHSPRADLLES